MEQILGHERGFLQYCGPNEISHEMRFLSTREIYNILGQTNYLQRRTSGKQEKDTVGSLD